MPAAQHIKDLKLFEKISQEPLSKIELKDVRKRHLDKLAGYRKRKEWEGWCEEDDID